MPRRMNSGSFFCNSATSSASRSGGSGLLLTANRIMNRIAVKGSRPSTRASRSTTRMIIASSRRENDGASSTTGPVKAPDPAISSATLAPMLCPTTAAQPSCSASSAVSRA